MSAVNPAFALLETMATQSRLHAFGLPEQEQIHQTWKGVAFELVGARVISPMGQVTEIIPVPHVTHIPRVKNWVKGVANVRGRLVPVIDLPVFFGEQQLPNSKFRRLMVVELGDYIVGLIVNRVEGMQQITLDQFDDQIPDGVDERISHFLTGSFDTLAGDTLLFDMQKLLYSEAFVQVAAHFNE